MMWRVTCECGVVRVFSLWRAALCNQPIFGRLFSNCFDNDLIEQVLCCLSSGSRRQNEADFPAA
jgi:hypothetical protein